jgi:lipoprotein-releasing system permease protein
MGYESFIAWRHLTRRRRAGFISLISGISVLGVSVGVMALIVVLAVMSGFDRELKAKIVGMNPHILIEHPSGIREAEAVVETIRGLDIPEVTSVARIVQGQAILRSEKNAIGVVVKGVDRENKELEDVRKFIVEGQYDLSDVAVPEVEGGVPSIVIGRPLARMLAVEVGESVQLISPVLKKQKLGFLPREAESLPFIVRGLFSAGMNDFDTQLALVDLKAAQTLYHMENTVSGISIRLRDVDHADRIKSLVAMRLGYPFVAASWIDMNRTFFSALKVEKSVMTILLLLIILVAAFNIVSTLIMVVMEKTRDIGILRALGSTGWGVRKIFLYEGFIVGALGVTVGVCLGLAIATHINPIADFVEKTTGLSVFPSDIYYFSEIPTEIKTADVVLIVGFALLASVLAAFYPADRAARLNPVDALRYE